MFDRELVREILSQIYGAAQTIRKRFESVESVDDLTGSAEGMEKLDSICMQLITIGESLKNLDKITSSTLLCQYPEIDWKGAKGLRDIISHHYFDVDAEAIYSVCEHRIEPLAKTISNILEELD
jgi:uncharacterized protein with HEPN domain